MQSQYFISRDSCPACNSEKLKEIYQKSYDESPIIDYLKSFYSLRGVIDFKYLKNASYYLCECNECDLIFQKEIPNDILMKILYEKWVFPTETLPTTLNGINQYCYYAQEIFTVIEHLKKVPSALCFFDFGMGRGTWASIVKSFGCESYGTDLSEEKIQCAISNGIHVIGWDEIPEHRFDFINTEQVFEHISNPLDTLSYLKGSLKDDGILKISVPTANDITRRLRVMDWEASKGTKNSLNPVAPLEHINCFRRKSLVKMAGLAGMEEVVIPMKTQYMFTSHWKGVRKIAKNLFLPMYRNILKRQNYLFFRNS